MLLPPNGPVVQGRPAIERFFSGFLMTIWRKQPDNSWLVIRGMWSSDSPLRR
jgi:hypothetical protein